MFTLEFDPGTLEAIQALQSAVTSISPESVIAAWARAVAPFITAAIREVLGHSAIYQLNPEYQSLKETNPHLFHPPQDTDPGQPLILTGALWHAIDATAMSDGVQVEIKPSYTFNNAAYYMWRRGALAKEGSTRKKRNTHIREVDAGSVADYAVKWELQTHFIEIGVAAVEGQLVELLAMYVSQTYGYDLNEYGGGDGTSSNTDWLGSEQSGAGPGARWLTSQFARPRSGTSFDEHSLPDLGGGTSPMMVISPENYAKGAEFYSGMEE